MIGGEFVIHDRQRGKGRVKKKKKERKGDGKNRKSKHSCMKPTMGLRVETEERKEERKKGGRAEEEQKTKQNRVKRINTSRHGSIPSGSGLFVII